MKILYLADNRVRGNFGCRATSTALSMLVGEDHEIVGRITGRHTNYDTGNLFFCKYFPKWVYRWVSKRKWWKQIKPSIYLVLRKLSRGNYYFGSFDFISLDMEKSISNYKKCHIANPEIEEYNLENYDFDALVVNGEGSFIFSTPAWRESLIMSMIMYWALKKGKKVYFMNAMFSDLPNSPRNYKTLSVVEKILSKCEIVVARESTSYAYVNKYMPKVKALLIPDALFTWYNLINDEHKVCNGKYYLAHAAECDESYYNQDFTSKYILIAGSSAGFNNENYQKGIDAYSYLVQQLQKVYSGNVYLIQVCEGDEFLKKVSLVTNVPLISMETPIVAAAKILANAEVFISGRYHPAIMASQGGTPCVFMDSNSHKTRSLQDLLGYDMIKEFNYIPSSEESLQMIKLALDYCNQGEYLRKKIKERAFELYKEARTMKNYIK